MTTDILLREDTGEMLSVRVVDPDEPVSAPYSRAVGLLDGWARADRRAVDEFSAWVEGQAAQALAEMRALCDELDLPYAPIAWADMPERQPMALNPDTTSHVSGSVPTLLDPVAAYMAADDPDDRPGRAVVLAPRDNPLEQAYREREARGWTPNPANYGPLPALTPSIEDTYTRPMPGHADQPEDHGRIDRWLIRLEQWWRRKQAERDQRMGAAE